MKTFHLQRDQDLTGTSGTGKVAIGLIDDNGKAFMTWISEATSEDNEKKVFNNLTAFSSIDNVIFLHGHGNRTKVVIHEALDVEIRDKINILKLFYYGVI